MRDRELKGMKFADPKRVKGKQETACQSVCLGRFLSVRVYAMFGPPCMTVIRFT